MSLRIDRHLQDTDPNDSVRCFTMASAQKVYPVKYQNQADVKVFAVKYENQADLKVFKVKYENQAGEKDGKWDYSLRS